MNINNLTEQQLNTLSALGQGWKILTPEGQDADMQIYDYGEVFPYFVRQDGTFWGDVGDYDPCNNGSQAMELVEKYGIAVVPPELSGLESWAAGSKRHYLGKQDGDHELADAPKLAIVRAFVASVYGMEIDYDAIVGGE